MLLEQALENILRKRFWLIPVTTLFTAAILYAGIVYCAIGFKHGFYWTILPSAFFVHAFVIVVIHDGSHRSITKSRWDSLIMNTGAGLLFLPFFAEPFRKYHLMHHSNTNNEYDPLWSETKNQMYRNHRSLYLLCQLIPLLFTAYIILHPNPKTKQTHRQNTNLKIRIPYVLFSCFISLLVYYFTSPSFYFLIGTIFILSLIASLRHWCEHMGTAIDKESNTFWFPLGMGIGNHEVHHDHAHFSWLTLTIGLWFRKKNTNPIKTLKGIFFDASFKHYDYVKNK